MHNIIHRNIKPCNVFLDENYQIKIGDFGLTIFVTDSERYHLYGTVPYLAPEIVKRQCFKFVPDIWAVGVMAYTVIERLIIH